ncbi:MAG: hypothetical protein ACR2RL_13500, partial [Gammaproteobacteria bacterium]
MTKPLPARNAPGPAEVPPEVPAPHSAQGPGDGQTDGPDRLSARVVPLRVAEEEQRPAEFPADSAEARTAAAESLELSQDRERAIGGQRIVLLHDTGGINLAVTVLVACAYTVGLWLDTPSPRVWLWLGGIMAVSGARAGAMLAFRRVRDPSANWRRWHSLYVVGSAASGIMWASAALLMPLETPLQQILSLFIIGGMLAGSMAAFVASVPAYFAFALPLVGGLSVVLLKNGGAFAPPVLGMGIFFVGVMSLYLRRLHRSLLDSILLQYENQSLIARMASMNEELEERVVSRTAELRRANRNLELDIEARRKAERALRDSEQRYRALYDDNPSTFLTLDRKGVVLSINEFGAGSL